MNGKELCIVGIGNDGVLSTTITHVPFRRRRETRLYVGGLVLPQNEHVRWTKALLRVGDEVRLKVVEAEAVDMPRVRSGGRKTPSSEAGQEIWVEDSGTSQI